MSIPTLINRMVKTSARSIFRGAGTAQRRLFGEVAVHRHNSGLLTAAMLSTLPPELLAIIVKDLDTKSIYNLYMSGLVCLQGLVTEFNFSMNTFATAKILETNFFRDTSSNLRVLNMSCARDLDCPTLLGAIRYLPKLTDLDVSYTKILMPDFLRFVDMAPKLTSIAINFAFGEDYDKKLRRSVILEYQEAFRQFKNVTFVSYPSVMHEKCRTKLAIHLLLKANLDKLEFEFGHGPAIDQDELNFEDSEMVNLSELYMYHVRSHGYCDFPIFDLMDFSKYEIVIFKAGYREYYNLSNQRLYITPFLKQFIPDSYHIKVELMTDYSGQDNCERFRQELEDVYGLENTYMFWERSRTIFDASFYSKLYKILQEYTVFSCKSPFLHQISQVPTSYNWYNVHHFVPPDVLKRNKVFEIDYGFAFKQHVDVKLNLKFDYLTEAVPRMINNFDFLTKLSHLSLLSNYNYDAEFFKTIFEECVKLETLQIIGGHNYDPVILQHLGLSKSLKNLLINRMKTGLTFLFICMSECPTLENIFIFTGNLALPNPIDLFKNCKNLYNLSIYSGVGYNRNKFPTKACIENYLKAFAVIKGALERHSINVGIHEYSQFIHNPFIRVFSVFKLEPL